MRIKKLIICLLITCVGLCGIAEAADIGILIKDGDFENGINGFGIAYSGREDTSLPYVFMSSDITSSGNGSLRFVSSETLPEKESVSPQSLGFAYQGIYSTDYISIERGCSYTVSADFYTQSSNVKMRFVEMDGNKAVAASPEVTLASGMWQTEVYKWESDRTTDKNRVRVVFYNITKNDSVYIDNFFYSGDFISDSSWKADEKGTIVKEENGFSYKASANSFKDYSGVYAIINKNSLDTNKKYVLSGYVSTDMQEAALYISADSIGNCFSEYQITEGKSAYVTLEFDPSKCTETEVKLSITAIGTPKSETANIYFTDLKVSEADTLMKVEQKNNKLHIYGTLRKGNENKALTVNVTGMGEFTATSDENCGYSITCDISDIQTSKDIFVSISGINGYSDCGGVINGYATIYNDDYRNNVAMAADEKTSLSAIKSVLTDDVLKNIGISKIRNYRISDKDFVLTYLLSCDISTYEKFEEVINIGSIVNGLSDKRIYLTTTLSLYGDVLKLDSVTAYKKEYEKADKNTLEKLFKECKTEIKSLDDLHYVITELLVKEKALKAVNYSEIMDYVTEYADDLSLNFSAYNSLSAKDKYTVANGFTSYLKDADSFKRLQGKLDELIANLDNNGNQNGGQNNNSSGTGSIGGASGGYGYESVGIEPIRSDNSSGNWKFKDLGEYAWASDSIYALLETGVISQSSDGLFRPADNVTRAEFAKMISVCFGFTLKEPVVVFDDVNTNDWYYSYVMALYENNIVNGVSDNCFGVNELLTRQDMCTILARIMEINDSADIKDCYLADIDSASDYAKAAIISMNSMGYVNGYDDGSFRPYNNTTRAEAAKLIFSVSNK